MPDKPPFYKQELDYSCVPACLRMVLAAWKIFKTEQELRELCDCMALEGTAALKVVDAARALGFAATRKQNLAFEELEGELAKGLYPIVYVEALLSPSGPPQKHAIVIVEIRENEVQVLDPVRGEFAFLTEAFLREWNAMRRLAILIK